MLSVNSCVSKMISQEINISWIKEFRFQQTTGSARSNTKNNQHHVFFVTGWFSLAALWGMNYSEQEGRTEDGGPLWEARGMKQYLAASTSLNRNLQDDQFHTNEASAAIEF